MRLQTKSARAEIKAVKDAPVGTFEAIVSVFGNVDMGGDRVVKGAFADTLAEWKASGDPIPVIWSHEWDDPKSHIGYVEQAEERDEGLYVKAVLDVENNDRAAYVARLLKERRVREFSFGYFTKEYEDVEDPDYGTVRELKAVDLFEVGPTLLGMNPDTVLLEAASALSGKRMSRKAQENIRVAYEALSEVVAGLPPVDDDGKAAEDAEIKTADVEEAVATDSPDAEVPGDTQGTIDIERLSLLLSRPQHMEE